jgi:type II secretory pathway component PulK
MNRRGIALLVVLWMLAALTTVTGLALAGVRLGARVSLNRKLLTRAAWAAEACVAIYRSEAADSMAEGQAIPVGAFPRIDLGAETWCQVEVADPQTRVNANTASPEALLAILGDSTLVRLVLNGRPWPAVEAIEASSALSEEERGLVSAALTVRGDDRINVNRADARVLQAIPGISIDAAARIAARRTTGTRLRSPEEVLAVLSPDDRRAVLVRYSDFVHVATTNPTVLVARATGGAGVLALLTTMTVTLVPAGNRVAIVRWESE